MRQSLKKSAGVPSAGDRWRPMSRGCCCGSIRCCGFIVYFTLKKSFAGCIEPSSLRKMQSAGTDKIAVPALVGLDYV